MAAREEHFGARPSLRRSRSAWIPLRAERNRVGIRGCHTGPRVATLMGSIGPETASGHRKGEAFPYLVIRLMAAVYQREAVAVHLGPARAMIKHKGSRLSHPGIAGDVKAISNASKAYFEAALVREVRRTKHRMCVVWGPDECTFVEPNGDILRKSEAPRGGLLML